MAFEHGNVSLYMGPSAVGGPDNLLAAIVSFIDGAQKKLEIAVQELDEPAIAEAILRAKAKGVSVRVVLEADYLMAKDAMDAPTDEGQAQGEAHEINRKLHNYLLRAKIHVNADFNSHIFHQKFIVRDRKAVLTGSTNFTHTGTHRNLNHLVIIEDKTIAKCYADEFKEIRNGHFGKYNLENLKAPKERKVSGLRIKALFAPDHSPEMEIMKQIAKAKERVDFAIFTFSKSSGIDDQLLLARKAGIEVNGLFYRNQANQHWAPLPALEAAGVNAQLIPGRNSKIKIGKLHHKLMVIDKQLVITGSFNYTGPANELNDENILLIGDLQETDPAAITAQRKFADFVLKEFDRIREDHWKPQ